MSLAEGDVSSRFLSAEGQRLRPSALDSTKSDWYWQNCQFCPANALLRDESVRYYIAVHLNQGSFLATMIPIFAEVAGFQAISEGAGVSIAVTGMLIVFFALVIISLFIGLLPVVLTGLGPILPRLESHSQPPSAAERTPADDEKLVAAIGFVLRMEIEQAVQSK